VARTPGLAAELRGAGRLAIDGVTGVAGIVEAVHAAIAHLPSIVGGKAPQATTGATRVVYRSVRGVARVVGAGVDASLSALAPLLPSDALSRQREALVSVVNGIVGDHLEASANPLAIAMQLRRDGAPLELSRARLRSRLPGATGKLLVQVHGLCMNDRQWRYDGHDHGEALARELSYTSVQLLYNTGLPVATNGRQFAALLRRLVASWPVPPEEIVLLCHSMGGLVARSALDEGFRKRHAWARVPIRVIFLGTPHHGAPLERAGGLADLMIGLSPYSAPFVRLAQLRSAGIQDLRHGLAFPPPPGGTAYAVAASTQAGPAADRAAKLRGDGLVPVASALGGHADPARDLRIPRHGQWLASDTGHLEMLGSQAVFRRLRRWLAAMR